MLRRNHGKADQPTDNKRGKRLLIIGHGMVAHRLCLELGRETTRDYRIRVIGEERHAAYDRIRLSQSPSPDIESLALADPDWYAARGIELTLGDSVVQLDRPKKQAVLESGDRIDYDLLVLATGSVPSLPPIEGIEHPLVQVFRTYDDLKRLREASTSGKIAAVIGGGLLGLETAKVLRDNGVETHVVEASGHLMPRQLDRDSAEVLRKSIEELGIHTHTGAYTRSIESLENRARLCFMDETRAPIDADMIVVAAGVRPRDELAVAAGLKVGARGGVIIDDRMRTSDPSIYAIGECVTHRGEGVGLVGPGYEMASALAHNLTGGRRRFSGVDNSCHLKLLGTPVTAAGMYDRQAGHLGVDVPEGRRTLVLDGRRLLGVTSVGDWPSVARAQDAAMRQVRLSERQLQRFRKSGELWPADASSSVQSWPEATVVCNCARVTRGQLTACIARGCGDVPALRDATGASATCGSCAPLLAQLVGAPVSRVPTRGRATLLVCSTLALLLSSLFLLLDPIPFSDSVQRGLRELDRLWRDSELKQWSGYGLVAVSALGGVLSLRKRISFFKVGSFGLYRAIHAAAGLLAVLGLVAHTGMRLGDNLNMMLMLTFSAVCMLGGLAGVLTAAENGPQSRLTQRARALRRPMTTLHLLLFWPLPLLIGAHVFCVYYF